MSDQQNPYAAPEAPLVSPATGPQAEAERIRKEHLKHEASVQSIGLLYYLQAFGLLLLALALGFAVVLDPGGEGSEGLLAVLGMAAFWAALAVGIFFVGRGLRRLQGWVKAPVLVLSLFGLLGFPIGTLISLYILWLVFSEKGKVVLSPQYQEVVRLTPHVKYRTPLVVWILLGLLLAFIVFVGIMAVSS